MTYLRITIIQQDVFSVTRLSWRAHLAVLMLKGNHLTDTWQDFSSLEEVLVIPAQSCFQIIICTCLSCCVGGSKGQGQRAAQSRFTFSHIIVFSLGFHFRQSSMPKKIWKSMGKNWVQGLSSFGLYTGGNSSTIGVDWGACFGIFSWHTSEGGTPVGCLIIHGVGSHVTLPSVPVVLLAFVREHPLEFRTEQHSWTRAWGSSHSLLYISQNWILEQPGPAEVSFLAPNRTTWLKCACGDVLVHNEWHWEAVSNVRVFFWRSL